MHPFFALLLALLAAVATGAVVWAVTRSQVPPAPTGPDPIHEQFGILRDEVGRIATMVQNDTNQLSQRLETRLEGIDSRVSRTMTETHTASQELARGIFETLGQVTSATQVVAEQARQFNLLQDLLKPPKARGGIGEAMLEQLLVQVLPRGTFHTQHRFASGAIVDAVVTLDNRLVPIDSKFPLANYERICDASNDADRSEAERAFCGDVAKHINDIAKRYIVPEEDTFEFAIMYIPAEGVYAEVLRLVHRGRPLMDLARDAKIMPLSPSTMYGYLQTVAWGLRCLSIEKNAEKVLDFCGQLQQDMRRFSDEYDVLGKHLGNARNKFEEGSRKLDRVFDDLARVSELADDDGTFPPALEIVAE
jgi:DNA recombination protein RmuC